VHVAAPITAGDHRHTAGGQQDLTASVRQLVGQLRAGLPASDYQHRPVRQGIWAAVRAGVALVDIGGKSSGQAGNHRTALPAAGDHHGASGDLTSRGHHAVSAFPGRD
jgi:hypothetical protein